MKNLITLTFITLFLLNFSAFAQSTKSDADQLNSFRQLKAGMLSQNGDDYFQNFQNFKSHVNFHGDFGDAPDVDWLTKFDGSGIDKLRKVVADEAGNLYVIGDFAGIMEFAGQTLSSVGMRDVFIVKLDNSGNMLWVKEGNSGAHNSSALYDMEITDTELIITGYFEGSDFSMDGSTVALTGNSDALLLKLTFDGQTNLLKSIGQTGLLYQGLALAIDGDQSIYLTGTLDGNTSWNHSSFLTKLDQSGNTLWWQEHEIAFNDLAVSGDQLYVAGSAYQDVWLGDVFLDPTIYADAFVAKANTDGNFEWAVIGEHIQNPNGDSYMPQIEIGSTGDLFMAGYFRYAVEFGGWLLSGFTTDMFILRLNSVGEVVWANSTYAIGKPYTGFGLLANDRPCISGTAYSWAHFDDIDLFVDNDYYAAVYDSSGAALIAFTMSQQAWGIAPYSENNILISGTAKMNASLVQYTFTGSSQNIVTGQGNSGTAQLTGLELDDDGRIYSLSNVYGHTDFFSVDINVEKETMVLAAQSPNGNIL